METNLTALQNFGNVLGLKVTEIYTQDKRKTVNKYCTSLNGVSVSPPLAYDELNKFFLGWSSCKKTSFPSLVDALKNAYFNLQVEADASIVFAVKTDSTRALLRNAISLATGETSEKVQTDNEDRAKVETIKRSLS